MGNKEKEFVQIAKWISEVMKHPEDEALKERVRSEVILLTEQFVFEQGTRNRSFFYDIIETQEVMS